MSINVGTAVGYLDLDTSKFKRAFNSAFQDLQVFNERTATSTQKLTGLSSAMTGMGSTLTKSLTVPLAGAGVAIIKTTADFESGMSEVGAISGATGEDLKKLSDKAKEMGAVTKFSASESAEALKYMAMAGWDTQKMLNGLPGVMNLAAASGEELGLVSDIVTDALTAFGMKAEEAAHFADVLAKASSKSNTNVGLMGETFKYVAPVAGALGFTAEDTAIAIGLMANAGIKGSQAGTSLRAAITRLTKPTGQAAKLMEELGISITNQDGSMKSFKEIMDMLRESMGGLTKAQQAQVAATIFGQESMSGMLAVINASEEDYSKLAKEIYNADGAAQQMADTMNDNLSGQLTILGSTIEGIALQFGEIMLPAIKAVVQGVQNFATWLNNTSETTKQVIVVIAAVLAALGPLLLIGGKLISGFLTIKALLGATGVALSAITGPIGIVIAAVAALALAWTTNFAGIRDTVTTIMGTVFEVIKSILSKIKYAWDSNFLNIKETVKFVFNLIQTIIQTALNVIEGLVQVFGGVIKGDWSEIWEGVKKIFKSIWEGIKTALGQFLNFIVDSIIRLAANLYVKAKEAWQRFWNGSKELWERFKAWFEKAKDDPIGTIKRLGSKLYTSAKNAFHKLWDGFKSVWKSIKSWFTSIGDWIADKLTFWKDSVSEAEKSAGKANNPPKKGKRVGEYKTGLSYVPYDGFPAILHKGERVLTAKEAKKYNNEGSGGNSFSFTFNSPKEQSPDEVRRQSVKAMKDLLFDM